ncbi:MAG: MFS transporter, partial [Nevskiales bacterium]
TYWDRREALHQSRLVESVTPYDPPFQSAMTQLHSLGLNDQSAAATLMRGVIGQGYLLSSLDIFYFSGWVALLLIPLCWIVRRPASGGGAVAAAD